MSILIWNIRGMGNKAAFQYLKRIISQHKPMIVGILEPKQRTTKVGCV